MIRTLGLALYGPLAASTRYRLGQYAPGLRSYGIDLDVRSLLGDEYLQRRFHGGMLPFTSMLKDGVARLRELRQHGRFDVAIVHCELFPFIPAAIEGSLLRRPYLYDMDDAFYLRYRAGGKRIFRPLLGNKFDRMMEGASAITAGNRNLADYSRRFNGNVVHLPTVVDTTRYVPRRASREGAFRVGWIGSPSTARYLELLAEPLSTLGAEIPMEFVVVGGKAPRLRNVEVSELAWSEATEIDIINSFDVGVMPLTDDEWSRGKCAFKLIQYMACGVPVVASPVGANADVISPDSGMLAGTGDEWMQALRTLHADRSLRKAMGAAARERVESQYSLGGTLPRLAALIQQSAGASPP